MSLIHRSYPVLMIILAVSPLDTGILFYYGTTTEWSSALYLSCINFRTSSTRAETGATAQVSDRMVTYILPSGQMYFICVLETCLFDVFSQHWVTTIISHELYLVLRVNRTEIVTTVPEIHRYSLDPLFQFWTRILNLYLILFEEMRTQLLAPARTLSL